MVIQIFLKETCSDALLKNSPKRGGGTPEPGALGILT